MSIHLPKIMEILKKAAPDGVIDGNKFYIPGKELAVYVSVEQEDESGNGCMAVLYFWLVHPSFEQPLFETAAAMGNSIENAVENAGISFYAGIYTAALDYLGGGTSFTYETDFFGIKKEWDVVESDIVLMGRSENSINSFWGFIEENLKEHIGDRSLYYIKVFASKQAGRGDIICEVRVNDVASPELDRLIRPYTELWVNEQFHSRKQFFFISQKTPSSYSYSREEIEEFTIKAAKTFEHCETDEHYDNLIDDISAITGDPHLAVELRNFMPEICAQNHFEKGSYSEYITIYKNGGEIKAYKDRFTPYYWITGRLINAFVNKELPVELYKKMITMSSIFNAYIQSEKKNADISSFTVQTGMYVPDSYVVR